MKKRLFIVVISLIIFSASGAVLVWKFWHGQDIVIDPNITEEYKNTLNQEMKGYLEELAQKPNDADVHIKIAVTNQKLGFLSEAERNLKKALKIRENNSIAYFYLGKTYMAMKKYDQADKMLRISIEFDSSNSAAFLELIDLYKKQYPGKANELNNIYRAGSDYTQSPEIWASYGQFLEDRREYRQAWIYWKEVLGAEPENRQAKESVERSEGKL